MKPLVTRMYYITEVSCYVFLIGNLFLFIIEYAKHLF
uniref:Uncharacterized protein n=1 Tax=Anguilla anguilla TaxID=7936 RepID=A0A0E9UXT2_ANGAN